MPAPLLTTLSPAPPGFKRTTLTKRELMTGTVVLLLRDLGEIDSLVPGALERLRGLVLTLDGDGSWQQIGPALWHARIAASDLPAYRALLPGLAEVVGAGFVETELARSRAIELTRLRADLTATRRDYNESLRHLSESEERFRALVEASRDWIWVTDEHGLYTYCSPRVRDLLGYEPQEVVGRSFLDLMPPEEAAFVLPLYEQAARDRRPLVNLQNTNLHRDGRLVVLETSAMPILDAQGTFRGYRGIDRDITKRKRAEQQRLDLERQILHAQKLESLGVLAGGIAHDFNNLLVAVLGNAELALMDIPEEAPGHEAVDNIRRAAMRAGDLTNQLLAYSGKGRFVVEPIDLGAVVQEMGRLLEVSVCKNARLSYDLSEDLPACEADAAQIRQVVLNLVINASEAIEGTPAEGLITLRTRQISVDSSRPNGIDLDVDLPAGTYVALEIADTGCGMTPEVKDRLFDPFFTTKFHGRGLGMAAVQGIVRGHGGALGIDSEPGRGTSIAVLLPASGRCGTVAADRPVSAPQSWQGTGTALIIDDDEYVREFASRVLTRLGFIVLTASDGAQGVALFAAHAEDIAVVLLDLTMPVMGGERAFMELQRLRPGVPVVLASGYNEQDATSRFTGAGLAGFVKKPFTIDELTAAVRAAVQP